MLNVVWRLTETTRGVIISVPLSVLCYGVETAAVIAAAVTQRIFQRVCDPAAPGSFPMQRRLSWGHLSGHGSGQRAGVGCAHLRQSGSFACCRVGWLLRVPAQL